MAATAVTIDRAARAARAERALVAWYAANKRDLPWRHSRDPYAILVAEVMLQQTQVDRVIPKWHAWLERFPKLTDLAAASRADAIRAWQGLGYNLRAIRLHVIARQVVAEHGGVLPRTIDGLLTLKGIGRYTAGAIACFADEQPVAMVDTNIRRVLSRVFKVEPGEVDALADRVVPAHGAYAWNQALMDLGATVCRSQRPLCLICPLLGECGGPGPRPAARATRRSGGEFHGSSRFYRGRMVDALRAATAGLPLETLVAEVGTAAQHERIVALVQQLVADGLLIVDAANHVRLAE